MSVSEWIDSLFESDREQVGLVFLSHSKVDGIRSKRVGRDFVDDHFCRCGFTANVENRTGEELELHTNLGTKFKIEKDSSERVKRYTDGSYAPTSFGYDLIGGTHRIEIHTDGWKKGLDLDINSNGYQYIERSSEDVDFYAGVIEGFVIEASPDYITIEASDGHLFRLKDHISGAKEKVIYDPNGSQIELDAGEVWRGRLPIPE